MRALLCCTLALLVCGSNLSADDKRDEKRGDKKVEKIDAKKLIGKWKWEPRKEDEWATVVMDFKKDGKLTTVYTIDGKESKNEGVYTVDGNTLITEPKEAGKGRKETFTITELTDTELVGTTDKGTQEKLVRIKDK
jgi:uncharacterized protein (TIGR03066 family)